MPSSPTRRTTTCGGTRCGTWRPKSSPTAGWPSSGSRSPRSASRPKARCGGVQLYRSVQRVQEESFWASTPAQDPNFVSYFGELHGFGGIEAPQQLELLPYTLTQVTQEPGDAANPFYDESAYKLSAGLDLKYGLTSNLTLDATINPDFGQVEADPSEVNLSAFETFFEERRPFFVEGAEIFRYGLGVGGGDDESLFYSRRIGRAPQGPVDDRGGYADAPIQTSILGAAKISGRTAGGWSIGVLDAVTGEEKADVLSAGNERFTDIVEPLTNYAVARLRKDLRQGGTQLGAVATAVHRSLGGTDLDDRLRSSAYTGGLDVTHRFRDDQWRVSAKLLGSSIQGSEAAILRAQRSSARYFQRPDADHVEVDSMATSLSGWASVAEIGKESGGPWRFATFLAARSPGFEVNDIGFMRETDYVGVGGFGGYRLLQPTRFFRRGGINVNGWTYDNFDGLLTARGGNVNGHLQFHNTWFVFAGLARNFDNWSTDALRGGPAIVEPGETFGWLGFETDERRQLQFEVNGERGFEDDTDGGWWELEVEGEWQATSATQIAFGPFYENRRNAWQYVATPEDPAAAPHYVFADLHQRTFGVTTRIEHTFTPRLSLQLYAQPFVSAGDYGGFREVIDPRAESFQARFADFDPDRTLLEDGAFEVDLDGVPGAEIAFGDPNFNFRELRSTLVARWEYRPGSTAYFVWSQDRDSAVSDPRFRPGDDFGELFDADARNVFLIKINGWLNL